MKSILVALDGSKDALNASEAAWKLARDDKSKIVVMSVIDTQSIWDFLGHKLSGLIGSGPYVAAFEAIHASLKNISDSLLMAFETRALGYGIETETFIGEGNLAEVVTGSAQTHDLIIMGRRARYNVGNHTIFRTSLSEKIAASTSVPVLMVSSEPRRWTTARFIFDSKSFDRKNLQLFFQIANKLKLQPELFCTDENEEETEKEIRDLSSHNVSILTHDKSYGDESWQSAMDVTSSTLMMVSTSERDGMRCVGNGPNLTKFMGSLPILSLLIFPPKIEQQTTPTRSSHAVVTSTR